MSKSRCQSTGRDFVSNVIFWPLHVSYYKNDWKMQINSIFVMIKFLHATERFLWKFVQIGFEEGKQGTSSRLSWLSCHWSVCSPILYFTLIHDGYEDFPGMVVFMAGLSGYLLWKGKYYVADKQQSILVVGCLTIQNISSNIIHTLLQIIWW